MAGALYLLGFILERVFFHAMTITLTWGASPTDLDSHLWLPSSNPSHVYYGNEGSLTAFPYAHLDADHADGYGPENISISQTVVGVYQYAVYNWSNESTLKTSGATVKVYRNSVLVKTYTASSASGDSSGTWWKLFTYDASSGVFTDQNTLTTAPPAPYSLKEVWPDKR
jgi:hypothetical protein